MSENRTRTAVGIVEGSEGAGIGALALPVSVTLALAASAWTSASSARQGVAGKK